MAALLVLVLAGYLLDGQLHDRELSRLLDRIGAAESTATYAEHRVAATVQYASPQLTSADVPPPVRRSLEQLVEAEAAGQVPVLQRAGDAAAGTTVLPWHRDVRTARDRYRSYAAHRLAVLRAGALDLGALRSPHPELDDERAAVRAALTAAGASAAEVTRAVGAT